LRLGITRGFFQKLILHRKQLKESALAFPSVSDFCKVVKNGMWEAWSPFLPFHKIIQAYIHALINRQTDPLPPFSHSISKVLPSWQSICFGREVLC